MIEAKPLTTVHKEPELTEICVQGHLDKSWCDWFMGLTITHCENGDTRLTGLVPDAAGGGYAISLRYMAYSEKYVI